MDNDIKPFVECKYSEKQIQHERHSHSLYELVYVCEGTVRFSIGDSCYDAGPHTSLFISKLEEHNLKIINGFYRRFYILLSPSQLSKIIKEPKLKSVFISRPKGFCHAFDLSGVSSQTEALMNAIYSEYLNPGAYSNNILSDLFEMFMVLCYRAKKEQFPLSSKKISDVVYDVQYYIDRHFTEKISVDELAEQFYLSPSYLSHAFREWTGNSPKQYIMKSRIAYAKELLITTDLSISDVALRSGFYDTSNFIRYFKKETNTTPLRYRHNGQ